MMIPNWAAVECFKMTEGHLHCDCDCMQREDAPIQEEEWKQHADGRPWNQIDQMRVSFVPSCGRCSTACSIVSSHRLRSAHVVAGNAVVRWSRRQAEHTNTHAHLKYEGDSTIISVIWRRDSSVFPLLTPLVLYYGAAPGICQDHRRALLTPHTPRVCPPRVCVVASFSLFK